MPGTTQIIQVRRKALQSCVGPTTLSFLTVTILLLNLLIVFVKRLLIFSTKLLPLKNKNIF